MSQIWAQCVNTLKESLPLQQFSIWIQPLKASEKDQVLSLWAPNSSVRDYVKTYLKEEITHAIRQHDKHIKIHIGVSSNTQQKVDYYTSQLSADYCFDNLVVGDANQVAYSATQQIAENIKTSPYNPFIIYGESGLGKTHLMQAAGHLARQKNPNIKIIYAPLMDFVKNITLSLRHNNIEKVKLHYQSADLLLVDDIHLIAGKDKTQEEFFHIFNFLFNTQKQIILTCDQSPENMDSVEKRLKSRFLQGLNLKLTPPELEMRAAILLKKSVKKSIQLKLNEENALFIASHITANVRALEGALLKLKAFVDFSKINPNAITKETIENALGDLILSPTRNVDILDIQKETAKHYALTVSDLSSKSRKQNIVLARHIAIAISHELTMESLTKIGKVFGNRDHSTVLNSIKKAKEKTAKTAEIQSDYELIKLKLTLYK